MTQFTRIRALALGGWLVGPITPALKSAGVVKLVLNLGPPGADWDVLSASTPSGPYRAHLRVGRSVLAPWFQFVDDHGREGPRDKTLAEALARLETDLTGETPSAIMSGEQTT